MRPRAGVFAIGSTAARAIGAALVAALALTGCGGERVGPEAEIRALVGAGERAAEARDANAVLALVSREYADPAGRDRGQLARYVRGLIALHPTVELVVSVDAIEVQSPEHARARLAVGLFGRRAASADDTRFAADLQQLELRLRRDDGEWRIVAAQWDEPGL